MPFEIRRVTLALAALPVFAVAALAAVIAFDSPAPLPPLQAGDSLPGRSEWNMAEVPDVRHIVARDGAPLTYRLYPGRTDRAVVLVHGSSGSGLTMHKLAQALQAVGATVYAISLRGHGGSGFVNGDTSYIGQLDDDLADFVKATGIGGPQIQRSLIGFSSGGGFTLRTASGANRALFHDYIAISPFLSADSPTTRHGVGGWVSPAVPRMIALTILDKLGLPWFQGLPAVRFATDAKPSDIRTPVYSFRLQVGMHLPLDWRTEIASIDRPTAVLLGDKDELFLADQFRPLFAALNPKIPVTLVPGLGHMDMIGRPAAWSAIAQEWQRLSDTSSGKRAERFDFKVREDFFAGLDGDKEAMDRALKLIADALSADPDNAQALVWQGDGRLYQSGLAFRRGAIDEGQKLSRQGIAEMDRAVALEPGNPAVRIPRATGLMPYARGLRRFDSAAADRLTELALGDFEFAVNAAAPRWRTMSEHDRGELLGALADGWLQLGNKEKADSYLDRMVAELPGTPYAANAALRRADPSAPKPLTCLTCH
jgi:non-heme chloroperoxidase